MNRVGIDADRKNDPTYPIRHRIDAEDAHSGWVRPVQQPADVEVLQSIEYLATPAVFGTSAPPSGLSGMIRRAAFAYSESSYLHWLPLVLADRINVIEGLLHDLVRGHIPNVVAEAGGNAELKYNRVRFIGKTVIRLAMAAAVVAYVRSRGKAKRTDESA